MCFLVPSYAANACLAEWWNACVHFSLEPAAVVLFLLTSVLL